VEGLAVEKGYSGWALAAVASRVEEGFAAA